MIDRNCITRWLPFLHNADVPIPPTVVLPIVQFGLRRATLLDLLGDGAQWTAARDACQPLYAAIDQAALSVGGYPCFLRTGHTSSKHDWLRTCHLPGPEAIPPRVAALVEASEMAGILGLPLEVFAVRRLFHTRPLCLAYRGLPIVREFRAFIGLSTVHCVHPYWPAEAVLAGLPADSVLSRQDIADALHPTPEELAQVEQLSLRVARCVDGDYSLDWMETVGEDGRPQLVAVDMAVAGVSYHWPECPLAAAFLRRGGTGRTP